VTGAPANPEQQLQQDYAMLETAKSQLDGLIRQQQLIQLAIEEHVRARETAKSMAKGSEGDDILVPIGADSYVHAKISGDKTTIVGAGSTVSIRRSPEEAEKILDEKLDELSRAFKAVGERATKTEALVQELSDRVQQQYDSVQGGQV
jgi:prefoldin alpha subunit